MTDEPTHLTAQQFRDMLLEMIEEGYRQCPRCGAMTKHLDQHTDCELEPLLGETSH